MGNYNGMFKIHFYKNQNTINLVSIFSDNFLSHSKHKKQLKINKVSRYISCKANK